MITVNNNLSREIIYKDNEMIGILTKKWGKIEMFLAFKLKKIEFQKIDLVL